MITEKTPSLAGKGIAPAEKVLLLCKRFPGRFMIGWAGAGGPNHYGA